jgi:rod shape-determining protein MreC
MALTLTAIGLIALSEANSPFASRMRIQVVDAFTPILTAVSRPVESVSGWFKDISTASSLREENLRLRGEIEALRATRVRAAQIESENRSLRALLGAPRMNEGRPIAARIIADAGHGFVRSFLIAAGTAHGVRRGLAVVNAEGLIGRVTEVGERSARVLLLVDLNSRISVRIQRTRSRAIMAGDNTSEPRLLYLPQDTQVRPGDRVVTSGHDGVLPPGIPVGIVAAADGGYLRVRPYVSWSRIEFVRVIDYEAKGLVPASPSAARQLR